ncbi:MAG: glycosyltransferase, partial [Bacteroidetes bacterium]
PLPRNGRFIGPLSRFSMLEEASTNDLLVVISGPEPQRTRFEQEVLKQLADFEGTAVMVLGRPELNRDETIGNIRIVSHLDAQRLQDEMARARLVVSRSGYSTIMDLAVMGKQAVFIPTPGQTEQEYLAKKYHHEGKHMMMTQRNFKLTAAWQRRSDFVGFEPRKSDRYKKAIDSLITSLF